MRVKISILADSVNNYVKLPIQRYDGVVFLISNHLSHFPTFFF
jgi:hypothetical protein